MSKNKPKVIISKEKGNPCPKCSIPMQRRSHGTITPKIMRMVYYFREWDYCRNCRHVQHYEEYKVINNHEIVNLLKETEEMNSLFDNIT